MNEVIFKIIDSNQFIHSHAFKDINLEYINKHITKQTFLKDLLDHRVVFSAVDKTEYDFTVNKENFYLFPFFYNHAENLETLDIWKQAVTNFIQKHRQIFSQKNTKLCICDPYETSSHFVQNVEYIADIYKEDFVVITANKRFQTKNNNVSIIYNDTWIPRFVPFKNILDFIPDKLYINLNRVARHHRCMLMDSLIEHDLLGYGYNTWGDTYEVFASYKSFVNPNTKIDQQTFDVLDIEDLSSINPNYFVPTEYCKHSFLFLNTETKIEHDQLFFSEKVYKPLAIGMPFITLGNPGTLQDLRSRGFLTFNDWFDETYDLDLPLQTRIQIITNNIKKYSKYSLEDLKKIRAEMTETLEHNLNLYRSMYKKNWLKESITTYVQELKWK
jgi:predicted DNA-binding protein YlxM (UPF0122 family)